MPKEGLDVFVGYCLQFPRHNIAVCFYGNRQVSGGCNKAQVVFRPGKPFQENGGQLLLLFCGLDYAHARAPLYGCFFPAFKHGIREYGRLCRFSGIVR